MIIDLPSTTTSQLNKKMVELRERGGAVALGRVLTLVIVAEDDEQLEDAIDAANEASREHPSRVIVVAKGVRTAAPRIDGQIRVGGDAGASEVVVLRLYGPLANQGQSAVVPLLLPDAPIVTWWPSNGPKSPMKDPLGKLAQRRITDSAAEKNPIRSLLSRSKAYTDGDTDLAWTRLTHWRAQLAGALDLPPYEQVTGATVVGEGDSPSTELLAGWLAEYLDVPVKRNKSSSAQGILSVTLDRPSGPVSIERPDGRTGTLTQPGQPMRKVALHRRDNRDCLVEELRRLDSDEVYEASLRGLAKLSGARSRGSDRGSGRSSSRTAATAKTASASASSTGASSTGATTTTKSTSSSKGRSGSKAGSKAKSGSTRSPGTSSKAKSTSSSTSASSSKQSTTKTGKGRA
ncbi:MULTISPECIES: glucose-6-phosphate dehydrogenase assembly protein OpcA [Prauserella salsuginis group]|uniref:Glucose-6-phosphate dehydrogenase assembly protein OpcA n=2 Tax=Prauserella salsuginis group TaxID=2893672 RepID=A0A839Y0J2_9PSEU|nr:MULTISPECIES: glucose-6-phosphate dehydrogenase assembly protein OpcA [Prauserella salsuginis group]MBB3665806.1 glucose-6-phosphate dehydrogenase assembly protein OpcA [Prauserella sediminis]MCR3722993.1 glucose-6-phosphate dehydrogenase assembly protein OpcA [Prauserella flava]MCR3737331.1 glucose-6-phosphate dehydrogenase assembly protein OpcA [Prauserella salsuginis]